MLTQQVVLVDLDDNAIGIGEKMAVHREGVLHRAFSIFIMNSQNEMLLQRRALDKYHSGGLWTNACCSHPTPNETLEQAVKRRLQEEMGFCCEMKKIFHFTYKEEFDNDLVEYEFDHVFLGAYNATVININPQEVADYGYFSIEIIDTWLKRSPEEFTCWFHIAYPKVRQYLADQRNIQAASNLLKNVSIHSISYPYLPSLNAYVQEVEHKSLDWAKTYNLVVNEKASLILETAKIGWLAARVYPNAGLNEVCFVSQFNTWLMFFDDFCDETLNGRNTELLSPVLNDLTGIMEQCKANDGQLELPLVTAFENLWQYINTHGTLQWKIHFKKSCKDFFEAMLWETENRECGIAIGLKTYERMRPFTGAMYVVFDLVEIIEGVFLEEEIRNHPVIREARLYAAKTVCWCNDILSARKEADQGDVYNLVLLHQREYGLTLEEATNKVLDLHNEALLKFMNCEKASSNFSASAETSVRSYIAGLSRWIRANYDWSTKDTIRYGIIPQ